MREKFIDWKCTPASAKTIDEANEVLGEYAEQGFTMTLRQLHYQMNARDPESHPNTKRSYKRLGEVMSQARLAGLVDWDMMEDRVRALDRSPRWEEPASIVEAVAEQYREDAWAGQTYRPEVWIEKDALAGVIENVCRELRIDFFACRGYVSQSSQYQASKRFLRYQEDQQKVIIFHLGDHDPSGIDMTRENGAKFDLLTGDEIEVHRLALNMDQVRRFNPPPNFAKLSDSRARAYIKQFGKKSWELDALDPKIIEALIRDNVTPLIDRKKWDKAIKAEKAGQKLLKAVSDNWAEVAEFVA